MVDNMTECADCQRMIVWTSAYWSAIVAPGTGGGRCPADAAAVSAWLAS